MRRTAGDGGVTSERTKANDRGRNREIGTGLSQEIRTDASQLPSRVSGRRLPIICCAMLAGIGGAIACPGEGTSAAYATAGPLPRSPFSYCAVII